MTLREKYDAATQEANGLLKPGFRAEHNWDICGSRPESVEDKKPSGYTTWNELLIRGGSEDCWWSVYDQMDSVCGERKPGWIAAQNDMNCEYTGVEHVGESLAEVLRAAGLAS